MIKDRVNNATVWLVHTNDVTARGKVSRFRFWTGAGEGEGDGDGDADGSSGWFLLHFETVKAAVAR